LLLGFTGSGKHLNLIAGLIEPDSGEFFQRKTHSGTSHERGIIFQELFLLPWLSVYDNIAMAVKPFIRTGMRNKLEQVNGFIEKVNLSHAAHKKTKRTPEECVSVWQLPERNHETRVDLMDEPLGALDALTRGNLQEIL
jgi:nitrate/nitrite transport system ATP-binding protein